MNSISFLLKIALLKCVLISCLVARANAEANTGEDIVIGQRKVIRSEILNEERKIGIFIPSSYAQGDRSYPVLYLLDGPTHFHHTTGIVDFLARNDRIPEMIVVSVANTNRTRDLTPSPGQVRGKKIGGGADRFLSFLGDELVPWVEKKYRTHPYRVLVGHSLGGLFGVHVLITSPNFFQGIIAISPSMQWDEQRVVGDVRDWLASKPSTDSAIYITAGDEGGSLLGGAMEISGMFSSEAPEGFRWNFTAMPGESHGSVPHRSIYDGLEFLFDGWSIKEPLEIYDAGGWEAIEAYYLKHRSRFGSKPEVPKSASRRVARALLLAEPPRFDDVLTFVRTLDPKEHTFSPVFFQSLGGQFQKRGDVGGEKECYQLCIERFPHNKVVRERMEVLGMMLPPPPPQGDLVDIGSEVLADYAGKYEFKPGELNLTVELFEEQLRFRLRAAEEPKVLVALSRKRFMIPGEGVEIEFGESDGEIGSSMTVYYDGREMVCTRIEEHAGKKGTEASDVPTSKVREKRGEE